MIVNKEIMHLPADGDIMKLTLRKNTPHLTVHGREHTLSVASKEIDEMINNALEELHWFCSDSGIEKRLYFMMVKNIM